MVGKIAVVVCLFSILVAIGLSAPVWHDEAIVLLEFAGFHGWAADVVASPIARADNFHGNPSFAQLLSNISALGFQITPPLHYAFLWLWRYVAGESLLSLRILSALTWLGMLAIFLNWSRSWLALALLMLSPMGIQFATLSRGYALAVLWIMLSASLLDPERGRGKVPLLLGGLCAALAVWTHYLALPPVAIIIVSRMLWSGGKEVRRAFLSVAIALAVALPVGYFALSQMRPAPAPFPGPIKEGYLLGRNLLRIPLTPSLATGHWVDLFSSLVFLGVISATMAALKTRTYKVRLSLFLVCGQAGLLLVLALASRSDLSASRYLALVLPFCCLLIADCCERFGQRGHYAQYVLLGLATLASVVEAFQIVRIERAEQQFLNHAAAPRELIMVNSAAGYGVAAAILHDVPDHSDFVVLSQGQDAAFAPTLKTYREAWSCPSDDPPGPEQAMVDRLSNPSIKLFREYSCNKIVRSLPE